MRISDWSSDVCSSDLVGAATEHTESGWWIPTMQRPMASASNFEEIHQAAFDVGRPHSVSVNRLGLRFVDDACGYDDFGKAMVADQLTTGAKTPCWLAFDAPFREKFSAGGILPTILMPDRDLKSVVEGKRLAVGLDLGRL